MGFFLIFFELRGFKIILLRGKEGGGGGGRLMGTGFYPYPQGVLLLMLEELFHHKHKQVILTLFYLY